MPGTLFILYNITNTAVFVLAVSAFVLNSHANHVITLNAVSNKWLRITQFICQNINLCRVNTVSQLIRQSVIESNLSRHLVNN
jgi:hypothetical protein